MRNKVIFAAFVVLLCLNSNFGQTSSDIEMKFGKPETVYSVSEHIWMTPIYAADGQVCMMRLYPKRIAAGINYLDDGLPIDEVLRVINDLIPINKRGTRKDSFGLSNAGGGVIWTGFNYERVSFTFVSSFRLDKLPERQPIDFSLLDIDEKSLAEAKRKEAMRLDDELMRERAAKSKVLEIRWANRKCIGL